MSADPWDYVFKYVIVGDAGVGKSCLLLQFVDRRFRLAHEVTIGVDFGVRVVNIHGLRVKLQIWDTAGQEAFLSVARAYYRGAAVALHVYDVTDRKTFDNVVKWINEVQQCTSVPPALMVVGNKNDCNAADRQVSYEEGAALAVEFNALFQETSARLDHASVEAAFMQPAEVLVSKLTTHSDMVGIRQRELTPTSSKRLRGCC